MRLNAAESKAARVLPAARSLVVPAPAWWLPGPHLPTLYAKFARNPDFPATTREYWPLPDGDRLAAERLRGRQSAPRLVIFHGLEGGTHSTYARGLLQAAAARGWWADLVLWRTCDGNTVNDVRRSYHSGASEDAHAAVTHILGADPARPTLLLGVSIGGNILLKWLGEQQSAAPTAIRAAAAVSVPYDLACAATQTEHGFSRLYGWFFLRSLKRKIRAKRLRYPDIANPAELERATTLRAFDDLVTAPMHGFADAADYYNRASSLRFLPNVRVPTLLLTALNDPFLARWVLDEVRAAAERNPYLGCVFPAGGGHVGFVSGVLPWRPQHWMEHYVLEWLAGRAV